MAIAVNLGIEDVHRHSLDEYHQMIECGGIDEDAHVELLDGVIVEMSPKTPRHEAAIAWLNEWLVDAVERPRYQVGVGRPLTLATSEPEPDLVVIERDAPSPYHPSTAALVIEVSVSSLSRDLEIKTVLYAAAGIPEYWVLDIDGRRLLVHRSPRADGYAERREYGADDRVQATAVVPAELDVSGLLGATGS